MVSYAELRDLAVLKLKELERQREKLEKSYSATLESADAASNPREKLKALYRGIQATTFADSPLHPDVDNLENLLAILEATSANGNSSTLGRHQGVVVQGWIEKLILEINRGKTRTKYAWLFGKILEEWFEAYGSGQISAARSLDDDDEEDDDYVRVRSSQPNAPARPTSNPEREQFFKKLSGLSTAVPESDYDISVIDDVLKGKEEWIAPVRKTVREYAKKGISKKVTANEVRAAVDSICRDNLVDQTAKQQLRDLVSGSDMLVNEYVGVLTVMLNNVDEWDWPAGSGESATANKSDALKQGEKKEPPTMRVRRNRSYKYRAFIDEDILTAVFLQIVGVRWSVKLKAHLLSFMSNYESKFNRNFEPMLLIGTNSLRSSSGRCLQTGKEDQGRSGAAA
ncbi:hypothetical protein BJ742DRAFT_423929 [Cladochytrium replicatum]|nr:hypothetical protein BJ742DRAFT_423929 [Cladochytrium replicatum]